MNQIGAESQESCRTWCHTEGKLADTDREKNLWALRLRKGQL